MAEDQTASGAPITPPEPQSAEAGKGRNKPKVNKKRKKELHEIVAVFVLSTMAVATAWCGFESSKWGGEMSIAFSQASSSRVTAANYESQSRDARAFDLQIYGQWIDAVANDKPVLADYIEERFTPAFAVAFDDWYQGNDTPGSPFASELYVPEGTEEAEAYFATADAKYVEALENNQRGDNYSLLTVLFALVLFLTAMSQRNISVWAARTLLGLAIVVAVIGIGVLLTFPIKI